MIILFAMYLAARYIYIYTLLAGHILCRLFKFRSCRDYGLNEELGRHRGREGKKECMCVVWG